MLVPLFVFLGMTYKSEKRWKKFKKILLVFLALSIILLIIRPLYEVNWEEPCNYVKNNYSENVTIYSSSPRVAQYYTQQDVKWLHPNEINNISANNTIIMFTCYDKYNLEDLQIMEIIEEKYMLLKTFDKIHVYGSKNLT